jgi:aldehyde dehydrogenase (NAD+)
MKTSWHVTCTRGCILAEIDMPELTVSGARELVGGSPERWVLPPHVFADVANDNPLGREEIFGPVAPLIRANDEQHARQLASETSYGLSSAVFAGDLERRAEGRI